MPINWPWSRKAEPVVQPVAEPAPVAHNVRGTAVAELRDRREVVVYQVPRPAPGVTPANMAFDSACVAPLQQLYGWANEGPWSEGIGFLGYPYLSELSQRPEYRNMVEIIAEKMTRKWIRLTTKGEQGGDDRIERLNQLLEEHDVQGLFQKALEQDGFFGRGQIFIDHDDANDVENQKPLPVRAGKIGKGDTIRFQTVEALWSYPGVYNASDPLRRDFYRPAQWWVNGRTVHTDRMITIVSREVPDILKPVYQFGGLALTQIAKPYVDNWLKTRESVSDLISAFSMMVLKTDMSTFLQGGGAQSLVHRAEAMTKLRDNRGLHIVDKESEEMDNVSAPLSELAELQAQSQEHMASVSRIPLVVLTGITPAGLNASSEGELTAFDDGIGAQQEKKLRAPIKRVIDILQLIEWGDIDPAIGFVFNPLREETPLDKATRHKTEADTAAIYIDRGVVSPDEERDRLSKDETANYDLSGPAPDLSDGEDDIDDEDRAGSTS